MKLTGSATFGGSGKKRYRGWRLKYSGEGGNENPSGMPAVAPASRWNGSNWEKYIRPVDMTEKIQRLQWDVMRLLNPDADAGAFSMLYDWEIALTNFNGFGDPSDPRVNWITGENKGKPEPKLMDAIIMAGGLYNAEREGDLIVFYPGVHAVQWDAIPDAETVIRNGWIVRAVSWHDKQGGYGEDFFKPGRVGPFYYAHIIRERAQYPAEWFEYWDRDYPPNPLMVGG